MSKLHANIKEKQRERDAEEGPLMFVVVVPLMNKYVV